MRRAILVVLALGALASPALGAHGKQVRYIGIHPVPRASGGGICYIEGPHVHMFDADKVQYRDHRGANYFVGDPVAYGYDGPRHAYKGHHPIHVDVIVGDDEPDHEYCYLNGSHYHYFAPPEGPEFKLSGDAYFYVGEPPRAYVDARPAMMKINAVYQPIVYDRPVIEIDAPVGWIGARAEFVVPSAAVVVEPPRAGVTVRGHIPLPSVHVDVGIGLPGVIVHERPVFIERRGKMKHHKYRDHRDRGRHRGHR